MSCPASIGDYVELVDEPEKRGYIALIKPGSSEIVVVIDEYRDEEDSPPLPKITLRIDRVKLVRRHKREVMLDMNDFLSIEYPCLGSAASTYAHSEIRFKSDSAMGRLPRPPAQDLPGPHSSLIKSKDFTSSGSQALFDEVYAGRFLVTFCHSFRPDYPSIVGPLLKADMLVSADPQISAVVLVPKDLSLNSGGNYSGLPTHVTSDGTVYNAVGMITFTPLTMDGRDASKLDTLWPDMHVSEDQEHALVLRVIHLLMRVVGCDLGFAVRQEFRHSLATTYVERGWWKEHLDSEIMFADIMVQTRQSDDSINESLFFVAQALEAAKCFGQSADLLEYCRVHHTARLSDKLYRIHTYENQGLACQRNHDLAQAEKVLLQGFRELFVMFKDQSLDQELFQDMASDLKWVYNDQATSGTILVGSLQELPSSTLCFVVLSAALYHAGCADSSGPRPELGALHQRLRNRAAARKALCDTFQTSSIEEFRSKLGSWVQEGASIRLRPGALENEAQSVEELRKLSAQGVRRDLRGFKTRVPCRKCSNPDCDRLEDFEKLLRCSKCKDAYYCRKECQIAHWKTHKSLCHQTT